MGCFFPFAAAGVGFAGTTAFLADRSLETDFDFDFDFDLDFFEAAAAGSFDYFLTLELVVFSVFYAVFFSFSFSFSASFSIRLFSYSCSLAIRFFSYSSSLTFFASSYAIFLFAASSYRCAAYAAFYSFANAVTDGLKCNGRYSTGASIKSFLGTEISTDSTSSITKYVTCYVPSEI